MAVVVVVKDVEEEVITIVTTTIEGRITIMELIYKILQGTLHLKKSQILFRLMYGTIFVLKEGQIEGGSIILIMVMSQRHLLFSFQLLKLYKTF